MLLRKPGGFKRKNDEHQERITSATVQNHVSNVRALESHLQRTRFQTKRMLFWSVSHASIDSLASCSPLMTAPSRKEKSKRNRRWPGKVHYEPRLLCEIEHIARRTCYTARNWTYELWTVADYQPQFIVQFKGSWAKLFMLWFNLRFNSILN